MSGPLQCRATPNPVALSLATRTVRRSDPSRGLRHSTNASSCNAGSATGSSPGQRGPDSSRKESLTPIDSVGR